MHIIHSFSSRPRKFVWNSNVLLRRYNRFDYWNVTLDVYLFLLFRPHSNSAHECPQPHSELCVCRHLHDVSSFEFHSDSLSNLAEKNTHRVHELHYISMKRVIRSIYSEKATKIWRNLQIWFEITWWHQKKCGDFVIFLWSFQNILLASYHKLMLKAWFLRSYHVLEKLGKFCIFSIFYQIRK